ncbi:unnamed protein product [marine sediment metagenome]|uniref:Uncharacterized protein n=1 Tax=marine sediment metagenome TaxID=412755 RepID=X0ZTY9_9ZZZZ
MKKIFLSKEIKAVLSILRSNNRNNNRDRHLFSFKIGELFKMDYSAVSQAAKRFEQKSKVNDKIKEC